MKKIIISRIRRLMIDRKYFFYDNLMPHSVVCQKIRQIRLSVKFKTSVKPVIINVLTMSLVANVRISLAVTHVSAVVVSTVMVSLAQTLTNAQPVSLFISGVFPKS